MTSCKDLSVMNMTLHPEDFRFPWNNSDVTPSMRRRKLVLGSIIVI